MAKKDYKDTMVMEAVTKDEKKAGGAYADASKEALIELLEKREALIKSYEAELDKRGEALKRANDRAAECSKEFDKLQQKAETLEKALSEAEDKIDKLEDAKDEIVQLKAERDELLEKIEDKDYASKTAQLYLERSYKAKIDDLNDRIESLTTELKDAKGDIKKLEADLKKAKKKADNSVVVAEGLKSKYLEDDLREELMREDMEAIDAEIDAFVEQQQKEFDDLKSRIKTGRAERFKAKRQEMDDRRAEAEEDQRLEREILEDEEYEAKLRARTEAKRAKKAAKAQSKQK